MHEELEFTHEKGKNKPHEITVYALSTCGFCKRALAFLRENDIEFRFIYVDKQSPEIRIRIKKDLRDNFEERLGFPYVILNSKEAMVGFREEVWKEKFLK